MAAEEGDMTFWATEDEQIQVAVGRFSGCSNHVPAKQRDISGVHLHNHGEMLDCWRYFSAFVRSVEVQKLFCGLFLGEPNLGVPQLSQIQEKIVFNRQRFGWSQTKHPLSVQPRRGEGLGWQKDGKGFGTLW